ncbi:MAG: fumarylacetoacetate hydrolase family protein, partial [Defluviitaleaceae bacterium]|nr:fumarylacetoacetate hydrolase family protein [Defluviitaleaceae bacterium]
MRYASFMHNGKEYAGVSCFRGYYPFKSLLGEDAPETMLDFIRHYENNDIPDLESIFRQKDNKPILAGEITLRAPIPYPFRHIICLGKNYADHAKEVSETIQHTQNADFIPQAPIYFTKTAHPAIGDCEKIPLHSHLTSKVDYEAELAVIIGKTASRISPEDAEGVIFGYTILNDLTARDIQSKHAQWFFGKSLDGFCPMGPHIVSRDEIPFPVALKIKCRVNGETRQDSNTSNLIFGIPQIISELSQGITLHAGDIIATGTPAGIGHAMQPPQYLKSGDKVECEIEK